MKINDTQLNHLSKIALMAGKEIMEIYNNPGLVSIKDDSSPLTQADLASDKVIHDELKKTYPDIFIMSEEGVSGSRSEVETFFLIDPLDGTKEFLKKNDEFTVNIALVHSSRVIAGIVYAPALGELYCAAKDVGVFKCEIKNHQITTTYKIVSHTTDDLNEPIRVVASRSHPSQELVSWLDNLKLSYELKMFGSSLKFCRLVDGSADVYPRFGLTSQWDTAAAQCIVELAGGAVLDLNGQSLTYGVHKDILNPSFIAMRATSMRALI